MHRMGRCKEHGWAGREAERQAGRQASRQTSKQGGRQAGRQGVNQLGTGGKRRELYRMFMVLDMQACYRNRIVPWWWEIR